MFLSSCRVWSSRGPRAGSCASPRPRASVPATPGVIRPSRARPPLPHGERHPRRRVRLQRHHVPLRLRLVPPPRCRAAARAARASSARRRKRSVSSREDPLTANRASKASRSSSADMQPRHPGRGTGGLEGFESHAESVGGTLSSAVLECARLSCPKTHRHVKTVPILSRHLGSAENRKPSDCLGPSRMLACQGARCYWRPELRRGASDLTCR